MWSLGKVIQTPEVLRVYIGSFWDQPLQNKDNQKLLEAEKDDLLADLRSLPRNSAIRKVNELVKRAKMAKVHAYIMSHLRDQFGWFGKDSKKKELLDGLLNEFKRVQIKFNLPMGDFPNLIRFREKLDNYELHKFPKLDVKRIEAMEQVLSHDIPELTKHAKIRQQEEKDLKSPTVNPFDIKDRPTLGWVVDRALKQRYDNIFHTLNLTNGEKVSGANVKKLLVDSALPQDQLRQIWALADIDKDGHLDADEFAVCIYLIENLKNGNFTSPPEELPDAMIPPSKRQVMD